MKAYFLAPQKDFTRFHNFYRAAIGALSEAKVDFTDEWICGYEREDGDDSVVVESAKYYQESMKDIARSDIVVFDATVSSMSVGHQMTYSLYLQKPTLLLVNGKVKPANDLFVAGSQSPFLTIKTYETEADIKAIVKDFVKKNDETLATRLNLALNESQSRYIAWASFANKKTKTKVVQDAIDNAMYSDDQYREWMQNKV